MFQVKVPDWYKALGVGFLNVTAHAISDKLTVHGTPSSPLQGPANLEFEGWDAPGQFTKKLGFPAGKRGSVEFSLQVDYKGVGKPPGWSREARGSVKLPSVTLPFRCTPEGDFTLLRSGRTGGNFPDQPLTVDIAVYQVKKHPTDLRPALVPAPVWDDWMKQMNLLRLVIVANLSVNEAGPGRISVTIHPDSVAPPNIVAGSTGPDTAVLGPFIIDLEPIDLAPPLTSEGGILYSVYFEKGSADIDTVVTVPGYGGQHQGNAFDDWLKHDVPTRWDVTAALVEEKATFSMKATASATGRDMTPAQRAAYNKKLSEKRLASVVERTKKTLRAALGFTVKLDVKLDSDRLKAIGDTESPPGVENILYRRCDVSFTGDDLKKAVKDLFGRKFRAWVRSPFGP